MQCTNRKFQGQRLVSWVDLVLPNVHVPQTRSRHITAADHLWLPAAWLGEAWPLTGRCKKMLKRTLVGAERWDSADKANSLRKLLRMPGVSRMDAEGEHPSALLTSVSQIQKLIAFWVLIFVVDFIPRRCEVANYTRNNNFLLFPV